MGIRKKLRTHRGNMAEDEIRSYKKQFEGPTINRIERQITNCHTLRKLDSFYLYYLSELERCLKAGVLLAALHVVCAILELYVRDVWGEIELKASDAPLKGHSKYLKMRELEEKRIGFPAMVDAAFSKSLGEEERKRLKKFYKDTRIPIQHGLYIRYAHQNGGLGDELGGRFLEIAHHGFEERIEDQTLGHIDYVQGLMLEDSRLERESGTAESHGNGG